MVTATKKYIFVGKYAFTDKAKYRMVHEANPVVCSRQNRGTICSALIVQNWTISCQKRQGAEVLVMAMVQPFRNSVTFTDCTDYSIIGGIDVYPRTPS